MAKKTLGYLAKAKPLKKRHPGSRFISLFQKNIAYHEFTVGNCKTCKKIMHHEQDLEDTASTVEN